ncbi:MAG: M20/M25/M40 family metallo-hydrolase [Defluviitaleaceae bacterium]|nr:M20/M25/M40 family metallo-hydrolase [Defluviitaleaceae bacterium]
MEIKEILKQMGNISHISGFETELANFLSAEFAKQHGVSVSVDKMGNFIAHKKGFSTSMTNTENPPKVMLMAHIDEIGMIVSEVRKNGFVKFSPVGGIDKRTILAQEVTIHSRKTGEKIFGVIGIKPPHLTSNSDMEKPVKISDMAIDTGLSTEKAREIISPGDLITINTDVAELQNNKLTGRALDNTAGIAVMYHTLQALQHFSHSADIYCVASVQEEVTGLGGETATYTIKPDIAIIVDVGFGKANGLADHESIELGKGGAITIGPNTNRKLLDELKKAAKKHDTPYQVEVVSGMTGTDAYAVQVSKNGVITAVVSVPLKYMHSTVEVIDVADVENTGKLIANYIMSLQNLEGESCYWKD